MQLADLHYTSRMEPFYPLASDADADPVEVAEAEARCSLALGRLDGLLAGLSAPEKALFWLASALVV